MYPRCHMAVGIQLWRLYINQGRQYHSSDTLNNLHKILCWLIIYLILDFQCISGGVSFLLVLFTWMSKNSDIPQLHRQKLPSIRGGGFVRNVQNFQMHVYYYNHTKHHTSSIIKFGVVYLFVVKEYTKKKKTTEKRQTRHTTWPQNFVELEFYLTANVFTAYLYRRYISVQH